MTDGTPEAAVTPTHQRFTSRDSLKERIQELSLEKDDGRITLALCAGTGCRACGCLSVAKKLEEVLAQKGLSSKVRLLKTGCHGFCEKGPLLVFRFPKGAPIKGPDGKKHETVFYPHVKPSSLKALLQETVLDREVNEKRLYTDPKTGQKLVEESEIPFYANQDRLIFGMNGAMDPTKIEDYMKMGGYGVLADTLFEKSPEEVIDEIEASRLRGRGGGGFPTGRKWRTCKNTPGETKYLICNADEGDPGAFMDRSLLEGNPHRVLEGMILGSYAIGAHEGFIYVRDEYPLAVAHATQALVDARALGLLGEDILGSGHRFDVRLVRGGGAFVCGESTALMASLEGQIGEPRAKYIHTVEEGLWGRPSNLNNVETWATVPTILEMGAEEFIKRGTEHSTGTKIFSLVGKVQSTGLVEVPMGMTLREIVEEIGGGVGKGRRLKAVQTGGPSGGCIPENLLDLPVDFKELTQKGSMMGSGGLIVMDDQTCMVDIARYFVDFLLGESCGKCVPCRSGLAAMSETLHRICDGQGHLEDLTFLEELGEWMSRASLCGLGQSAANPVLSTLRYFRSEYEAHINEGRCPAGVCKELIEYRIVEAKCTACGACVKACPVEAIIGEKKEIPNLDAATCIKCGACIGACRFDAVERF